MTIYEVVHFEGLIVLMIEQLCLTGDIIVRYLDGSQDALPLSRCSILNDFLDDHNHSDVDDAEYVEEDSMDLDVPQEQLPNAIGLGGSQLYGEMFGEHDSGPIHDILPDSISVDTEIEQDAWKHLDDRTSPDAVLPSEILINTAVSKAMLTSGFITASPLHGNSPSSTSSASPSFDGPFEPLQPVPSLNRTVTSTPPNVVGLSETDSSWIPFAILPTAPEDHAFLSQLPPSQQAKSFMQRLNKEYRVLSSSLPG